jgi:hypothetical protein
MLGRILILVAMLLSVVCWAQEDGDDIAIQNCLKHWSKSPFKGHPHYRTVATTVKVLGIGGDIKEMGSTPKPELVLIKPSVTVLAKTSIQLMNPNGWYCIKANVSVLGKSAIELHCKANLATSKDGATVLGGSDTGGVAVLGSIRVERICRK